MEEAPFETVFINSFNEISLESMDQFIISYFKRNNALPELIAMEIEDYFEFTKLFIPTENVFEKDHMMYRGIKVHIKYNQ